MTGSLEGDKVEQGGFNGVSRDEEAVVLKDSSLCSVLVIWSIKFEDAIYLFIAKSLSDVFSFVLCKDDTVELGVQGDILG